MFLFTSLLLATRPAYIKVLVEGGEGGEVYFMPFTPQDSNGIRLYGGILPRPTPRLNKKSMSFSNIRVGVKTNRGNFESGLLSISLNVVLSIDIYRYIEPYGSTNHRNLYIGRGR